MFATISSPRATSMHVKALAWESLEVCQPPQCATGRWRSSRTLEREKCIQLAAVLSTSRKGRERWFVAAHAWDLQAARKAGFKTAFLEHEEHDAVEEVFGKFDLYAKDFPELLEQMKGL